MLETLNDNEAKCGASRSALLTGQFSHQGPLRSGATFAEVLKSVGYRTLMSGKWHNTPRPTDYGFDRYFGLGYPVRAIRKGDLLYLHNFAPNRWPCGDPELDLGDTDNPNGTTRNGMLSARVSISKPESGRSTTSPSIHVPAG